MLPLHFGSIMFLLATEFPTCMRKIIVTMCIVTMGKIATIAFLDTGSLLLMFYYFLFGQSQYVYWAGKGGQNFSTGGHCQLASWLVSHPPYPLKFRPW